MAHRKKSSTPFDCVLLTSCAQGEESDRTTTLSNERTNTYERNFDIVTMDTLAAAAGHSNVLQEDRSSAEIPAKLDSSSSVAAFVPSTPAPLLYDPFDQRHPLERNNVSGLSDLLPKELRNLVFSHLNIPMKFYSNTEYNPHALFAVRITYDNRPYSDTPACYLVMTSFKGLILNLPESIYVDSACGISFHDVSRLRSLAEDYLDRLKVLFITINEDPTAILRNFHKIGDCLRNVSMLVLEKETGGFITEMFVFELWCMQGIERVLHTIISNVVVFLKKKDLDGLNLLVEHKSDEQEFQLKEAYIEFDMSFLPIIHNDNIRSTIRWDWNYTKGEKNEKYFDLLKNVNPCHISGIDDVFSCDVEAITNLRNISGSTTKLSRCFTHPELLSLHLTLNGSSFEGINFSTLPNLQYLQIHGLPSNFTGDLRLENNTYLRVLVLGLIGCVEVYTGETMFELEKLILIFFHGTFCQPEKLNIRELNVDNDTRIDLVQQLSKQAKKVIVDWNLAVGYDLRASNIFSDTLKLNIVAKYRKNNSAKENPFDSLCVFQNLTSLELKKCRAVISPMLLPNMAKLYLEDCKTTFSLRVENNQMADQVNVFRALEVLEIRSSSDDEMLRRKMEKNSPIEFLPSSYLIAPRLHKLVLLLCTRQETFLINRSSCPDLKTFMWRGHSYNSLPFSIYSEEGPIFPKLQELALDRLIGDPVKYNNLSSLLCIDCVSILSLTNYSFVDNLDQLSFSCRLANFSLPVVRSGWKKLHHYEHRTNEAQCTALGKIIRQQMRNIELLMIDNFVVHSSPVEQIVKRLRGDAVSNSDDEKEDFDDDGWNENRNQALFEVDAFDDIFDDNANERPGVVGKKVVTQDDDLVISLDDWS